MGIWNSICAKLNPNATLRAACRRGDVSAVSSLLTACKDLDSKGAAHAGGKTALHEAASAGHLEIVELLLAKGADREGKGSPGSTPLSLAAWYGRESVARCLVAHGTTAAGSLLAAVHGGNAGIVELLLASGADVKETGFEGWTALHQASTGNQQEHDASMSQWLTNGTMPLARRRQSQEYLAIAQILISRGADIDAREQTQKTPLFFACTWALTDTARLLLENGANVNLCDDEGTAPLHQAALDGAADLVKLMLSRGANVNVANTKCGTTPLHAAASSGSALTVSLLLDNGADPTARRHGRGQTAIEIAQAVGKAGVVDVLRRHRKT